MLVNIFSNLSHSQNLFGYCQVSKLLCRAFGTGTAITINYLPNCRPSRDWPLHFHWHIVALAYCQIIGELISKFISFSNFQIHRSPLTGLAFQLAYCCIAVLAHFQSSHLSHSHNLSGYCQVSKLLCRAFGTGTAITINYLPNCRPSRD